MNRLRRQYGTCYTVAGQSREAQLFAKLPGTAAAGGQGSPEGRQTQAADAHRYGRLAFVREVRILEKSFLFNRKAENVPAFGLPVFWLREIPPKPGFDGLGGYCQPERSRGMQGAFHGSAIKRRKSESKVTFERARSRPH